MKEQDDQSLALRPHRELVISPVMDLTVARARMAEFQEFVAHYLEPSMDGGQDGGDYGPIPGAGKKKVLLKSGADKLCELYGIYDEYEIDAQEDFATKLFYYKIKCILKSRRDDSIVGTGLGSCSTYESKYRWRDAQRACPNCGQEKIIKGREEYGGGWLCFAKKGGCGQKFKDGEQSIEGQTIGRIENPDIMDTVNTVLKMAKKRAKIDAVIGVTRSSGLFTQDLETEGIPQEGSAAAQKVVLDRKLAEIKAGEEYELLRFNAAQAKPLEQVLTDSIEQVEKKKRTSKPRQVTPSPNPDGVFEEQPELIAKKWFTRIETAPTIDMLKDVGLLLAETNDAISAADRVTCRALYGARMKVLVSQAPNESAGATIQEGAPKPADLLNAMRESLVEGKK